MVNMDKSAIQLSAVLADFYPFILYHMGNFFDIGFLNVMNYEVMETDDTYSHNTRFTPIEVSVEGPDPTKEYKMLFFIKDGKIQKIVKI